VCSGRNEGMVKWLGTDEVSLLMRSDV
jgi:hypothetical protein